jgi:signal transduction histidine kinase
MNTIVPKLAVIEANNDGTERTLAPAERLKVRERLIEAAKMEAIGRFVVGIAHDFNNVLAAILAYAELLHDQLPEQSRQKGHAENVLTAAARGRALVDQMLAYSRREVGEREPIDLVRIVAETLDLLRGSLPPHVALDWHAPVSRLVVIANATELHRVVMNVCSNAMHALGPGGILRVALALSDVSAPRGLSHGRLSDGCYACLTVEDTGCGMDAATVARTFEPFFTTKKAGGGTGLGLSLVHAIVTDLAGAIDVKSSVGRGTTFAVYLPLR